MKAKFESATASACKGDTFKLDLMKEVERQTLLEVQQGLCATGIDEAAFHAKFTDMLSSGPGPCLVRAFTRAGNFSEMLWYLSP